MNEKIKEYLEKAKTLLGKVSKKIWIIAAVVVVLIAAGVAFFLNNRPYSVLITSANQEEISTVMSWLETQGIRDYRVDGMTTILVPSGQETNLKARLMMEGYPKEGYSYDTYYEHVSALSTEAERNTAYLLLIQDRIGAILGELDGVERADVTITQSDRRGSVLSGGNVTATAGIVFHMRDGRKLTSQQANNIRNFVAHCVQGLEISSVEILDNWGNSYNSTAAGGEALDGDAYALKMQLEEQAANKVQTQVLQILIPFYGADNVKVAANCVVEMSSSTITDYQVNLPPWAQDGSTNGKGIIGSFVYDHSFTNSGEEQVGGTVGTETNADWPQYMEEVGTPPDGQTDSRYSGDVQYDNSKTQTSTIRPIGYISDCTVSVSINSTTAGAVDVDAIRRHAAMAANITPIATEEMTADEYLAGKVSVVAMPFYQAPEPGGPGSEGEPGTIGGIPIWIIIAAAAGLLLFVVVLVVILLLRRKKKQKQQELEEQQAASVEELLEAAGIPLEEEPAGADVMDIQTERSMELRKDIRQFVDENPEIAAQMLKNWLKGDDDNG